MGEARGSLPWGRLLRWTAIILVVACGVLAPRYAPPLLANIDAFRAADVQVAGLRYLEREEVLRVAGITRATSVWDDLDLLADAVAGHPLVRDVSIRRELPDRVILEVVEREPVGLVATPTLEPVDRMGRYLPLDPSVLPLDLPLLVPSVGGPDAGGRPSPARLRMLAGMDPIAADEIEFWSRVSELRETDDGIVAEWWGDPEVVFQLGERTDLGRLQQGVAALKHALAQPDQRRPQMVDLRWADQVVVRYRAR